MTEEQLKIQEAAKKRRFGSFVQSLLKIDTDKTKLNATTHDEDIKNIAKFAEDAVRQEAAEKAKMRKQEMSEPTAGKIVPPQEPGDNSEIVTFIKNNFSSIESGAKQLYDKIKSIMKKEHVDKYELKIDKNRTFIFETDKENNTVPMKVSIYDKRKNYYDKLLYVDDRKNIHGDRKLVADKVAEVLNELGVVEQEKPDITEYNYRSWDISYQNCEEPERTEKINKNYFEMKHSGFYDESQLNMLYRLMNLDYDINCFANPLYTVDSLTVLVNLYEQKNTPEHENLLRDLNKFCANNFKYPLSTTEFGTVVNAAYHNNLNKLMSNPNINAEFKLFYLFDQAFDTKEPQKYNIGNTVFVIKSDMSHNDSKITSITNSVFIELPDEKGNTKEELIYQTSTDGNVKGNLGLFFKMYNEKHAIKDAGALLKVYMDEVRTAVKDDSNLNNRVDLKLNNGDKLIIQGIKYIPGNSYVVISDTLKTGCEIFLEKKNQEPIRVYSDNPSVQIGNLYNLNNLIKQSGGIENESKITKQNESIEDAILKTEEKQNGPEEIFEEQKRLAKQNGKSSLKLSNGKTMVFVCRKFKENDEDKEDFAILGMNEQGKREKEFKNIFKGINGIERTGSEEEALKYYKEVEYGKDINEVINNNTQIDTPTINENEDLERRLANIYDDKDI